MCFKLQLPKRSHRVYEITPRQNLTYACIETNYNLITHIELFSTKFAFRRSFPCEMTAVTVILKH
jgi:hypothetical protein